jgi:hypothetical protein
MATATRFSLTPACQLAAIVVTVLSNLHMVKSMPTELMLEGTLALVLTLHPMPTCNRRRLLH